MDNNLVWIIDDDESIRWVLEKGFTENGLRVETFDSAHKALKNLDKDSPKAILTDIKMPGTSGLDLLDQVKDLRPEIPIIIMTAHSDLESAVDSYEHGAWEYLPKPFDIDDAIKVVKRAMLSDDTSQNDEFEIPTKAEIVGESPAMQEVFRAVGKLSNSNSTVLLVGQSGTGKELVAKALFQHSPRKSKPFIALNMADIPRDLLEAELFGHEKGAFTGAEEKRIGRFEQANEGTLFLDEIGDMPLETQTRLLRVLSNGEFYRVGGTKPMNVDVRIIAATHQSLDEQVKKGVFREDLFHRLNVIKIYLPNLSEKRDDIPALCRHFLQITAEELNEETKYLTEEVEEYLSKLAWPGNVRQLENVCRWLTVMTPSKQIRLEDLPSDLKHETTSSKIEWTDILKTWADDSLSKGYTELLDLALPKFEQAMIEAALKKTMGKKNEAAKLLGWGRNTLSRKIKELGIT